MKVIVKRAGSGQELHDFVEERVSTIKVACGQTPVKTRAQVVEDDEVTNFPHQVRRCPRCAGVGS